VRYQNPDNNGTLHDSGSLTSAASLPPYFLGASLDASHLRASILSLDFATATRGKGNKKRLVPFSVELRRTLFRYASRQSSQGLLFGTRNGTKVSVRNFERDLAGFAIG
jgi:site-specific recombinase XerD